MQLVTTGRNGENVDAITAKWFDATQVAVVIDESAKSFDGWLHPEEVARLTGAPKGSEIVVRMDDGILAFEIKNAIFSESMHRYLIQRKDGTYGFYLKNAVLVLQDKFLGSGIGPRCVIREIHEAAVWGASKGIPIKSISVSAVGNYETFNLESEPMRGYYVWPTMGFDSDMPQAVVPKLAQKYQNCNRIIELMETEDGRDQWLYYGESVEAEFDLTSDSLSWKRLVSYMSEKGIVL